MEIDDEQLMVESSQDSIPAFELLVRRWDRRMLNFFHRCVGDLSEAEDLRQELFLRIYQQRRTYHPSGYFDAWLYRVATNLVIDKHARKRRLPTASIDETREHSVSQVPVGPYRNGRRCAAIGEFEERIFQALQNIPETERIALILRHLENRNFREIAELIHEPESTVKSRVYRGLQSLRDELKKVGILGVDCLQST